MYKNQKKIIGLGLKTKKLWENPEYRTHMSEVHLGQKAWNKGKKTGIIPKTAFKKGEVSLRKGTHWSDETRKKYKKTRKGLPNFKRRRNVHKIDESKIWRTRIEYRLWREAVFARDNWTCQKYRIKGGKLHPHHIQNFAQYPELRFAIDNGITLSKKAHIEFHKIYGKKNNNPQQIIEFLK